MLITTPVSSFNRLTGKDLYVNFGKLIDRSVFVYDLTTSLTVRSILSNNMFVKFRINVKLGESELVNEVRDHVLQFRLYFFYFFRRAFDLDLIFSIGKLYVNVAQVLSDFFNISPFTADNVLMNPSGSPNC